MTYGEFVKSSLDLNNKTIIVDEAHNLRNSDDTNDDKDNKAYDILLNRLKEGKNNRLVLMSATPMYNRATEIVPLLNLLLLNCLNIFRKSYVLVDKKHLFIDDNFSIDCLRA